MRDVAGWMARIPALFGQCRRCTRSSMIAAMCAWVLALLALLVPGWLGTALALALVALGLTALWIAHLVALASRGTLTSMLRQFGAERGEASAIVVALGLPAEHGGRLREGESLNVRRGDRPGKPGRRLTRVVISSEKGVIAAVGLNGAGSYERLAPQSVEAET
jgi:hypothetical protein